MEKHFVQTKDGFILELHRLIKSSASSNQEQQPAGTPVLLQHGLFQSSGIFITSDNESLAFYLADRGFDVWLGNNRGVSINHSHLHPSNEKYWDWSLDELAMFDFPAMIDYIREKTGFVQVVYAGHSQGNAQAFLGLSHNPALSEKIKLFIALCPAFYINQPKFKKKIYF